jgi:Rps23 Pro-64 3,4-dihydroxylase Tpa1-like proline 4-hydroxylase
VASFQLNLTPEWRPEWGGLLEFRGTGHSIEGILPRFNSLDIYTFPQGHWIGAVAPYARGPRLAIAGRLYRKDPKDTAHS